MRALITNDDGVDSRRDPCAGRRRRGGRFGRRSSPLPGGTAAVRRRRSRRSSATGGSCSTGASFDDLADVQVFAVEAAPAFIVRAAVTGAFGAAPDLVLSGINRGPNTGHAVLHSGTVGAALTASTFGLPAMAVSIDAVDRRRRVGDGCGGRPGRAALAARCRRPAGAQRQRAERAARRAARLPAHRTGCVRCSADGRDRGRRGLRQAVLRGHRRRARAGHRRRRPAPTAWLRSRPCAPCARSAPAACRTSSRLHVTPCPYPRRP